MPWVHSLIDWWQLSSHWDVGHGMPAGPPEWPNPGGLLAQPAKLVQAVTVLRSEIAHVRQDAVAKVKK